MKNVIFTDDDISKIDDNELKKWDEFKEKFDDPECPPIQNNEMNDFYVVKANSFPDWYKPRKKTITIRLDIDVIEKYKSLGKGYQTKINDDLRKAIGLK